MTKQISIKTKFGWISAYETKGKIFKIQFGKLKNKQKVGYYKILGKICSNI